MPNKVTTIRQQIYVPAAPTEVYNVLVNPEQHAGFTEARVTGQPQIGNSFSWLNGYAFGVYLDLEEDKRIVLEWQTEKWPSGSPPSNLELVLDAKGDGTEITLTQSGVPADYAELLAQGWMDFYWAPLQRYFERKKAGE